MNNELGLLFRTLRKERRLTQEQLALSSAVSLRAISYWEAGSREPRVEELQSVLHALKVTPEQKEQAYLLLKSPRGIQLARSQHRVESASPHALDSMPDFGDLLAALRMRRGWSRQQLATAMQVKLSSVSRWEHTQHFPTEESLDRLCTLLGTSPEERMALMTRRLQPQEWKQDASLTAVRQRVQDFCVGINTGGAMSIDLHALALKRKLWLAARSDPQSALCLAQVDTAHGNWLLDQNRLEEAAICVHRALKLAEGKATEWDFLTVALNIASYHAMIRQNGNPEAGVTFLRRHLPAFSMPQVQAYAYCDMAYYAAATGRHTSALCFLQQAQYHVKHAAFDASVVSYCRLTLARVLAQAGKIGQALDALPPANSMTGRKSLFPTFVRAEMLWKAGLRNEAHEVVQWLYAEFERNPNPRIQQIVDRLADKL